jgi:hypothetical protein
MPIFRVHVDLLRATASRLIRVHPDSLRLLHLVTVLSFSWITIAFEMFGAAMTFEDDPRRAMAVPQNRLSPRSSRGAQALARWGDLAYWVALAFAALSLLTTGVWSALSYEPLWMRLITVAFLGFLPALAFYLIGHLMSWTLNTVSAIYEFVVPYCERTFRFLSTARVRQNL